MATGVYEPALGLGLGLIVMGFSEPAFGLPEGALKGLLERVCIRVGVSDLGPRSGVLVPIAVLGLNFGKVAALGVGGFGVLGVLGWYSRGETDLALVLADLGLGEL